MMAWNLRRRVRVASTLAVALVTLACGSDREGEVQVVVPEGASASRIAEVLEERELVGSPRLFRMYVRLRGSAESLKSGTYRIPAGASWAMIVDLLAAGAVETVALTAPEGYMAAQIAARVAEVAGAEADSVEALVADSAFAAELGLPGPDLEGYLFPETYHVAEGLPARAILRIMVERYQEFWTPERRALADSSGRTEREIVTLASIVEKEARVVDEMPVIAGVYANRLEIGMPLQADPTVQYALGSPRARLLYASIDSVADHPYNTYTNPGLPPGPIASPGEAALRAALEPADVPYLFFVARADGSHEFTRTLREHINAKNRIRDDAVQAAREARAAAARDSAAGSDSAPRDSASTSHDGD
jgi:UPF0755 protein